MREIKIWLFTLHLLITKKIITKLINTSEESQMKLYFGKYLNNLLKVLFTVTAFNNNV